MQCSSRFVGVFVRLLAVLALAGGLEAQSTDWEALHQVPEGTKVKIKLKHRPTFGHCILEEVADDHLDCFHGTLGSRRYVRDDIRQVLLGRHSARTGFLVGAGSGVVLGAARGCCDATGKGLTVVILAPLLGGLGAAVGALADPMIDGKTIYRSPDLQDRPQSGRDPVATSRESPENFLSEVTMKSRTLCCLLTLALPISLNAQAKDTLENATSATIITARCQYTPGDSSCSPATSGDSDSLAQVRGRMRPMPARGPLGYPRSCAPMPEFSGRHVLIGGIIGFGLGAAIGAKGSNDPHPWVGAKAALLVGTFGGLIGAAIGATVPSFQARNLRHRGPWPQSDQDEVASNESVSEPVSFGTKMNH